MIEIVQVKDKAEGQQKAHGLLKKLVDQSTLLALSGGTSPDYRKIFGLDRHEDFLRSSTSSTGLRKMIVEPGDITPGAICVTDDRYGESFHENSNELLFKKAGLKDWADKNCIETHKILEGNNPTQTAAEYENEIVDLFKRFKRRVGVMGVGNNVHTAGVFPYSLAAKSPDYVVAETVDDQFPKRITLTLKALGQFTSFIVLAFGSAKQDALKIMMDEKENDMQKYPAIFYRKSKIKTYLITDISP